MIKKTSPGAKVSVMIKPDSCEEKADFIIHIQELPCLIM